MEKLNLRDLAEDLELEAVETTSEAGGYPRNLRDAIIGFDSFHHAESVAKRYGLDIIELARRDGQQLWTRMKGAMTGPYDMRRPRGPEDRFEYDGYQNPVWYEGKKAVLNDAEFWLKGILEEGGLDEDGLAGIAKSALAWKEAAEQADFLEQGKEMLVCEHDGSSPSVEEIFTTGYRYDTMEYTTGLAYADDERH